MKLQTVLVAAGVAVGVGCSAWAEMVYTFAPGETTGVINDDARWSGSGNDRSCSQSGEISIPSGVDCQYWRFGFGSSDPAKPTVVRVLSGGTASKDFRPGGGANSYGVLDVEAGGHIYGTVNVGTCGFGVVTNRGDLKVASPVVLGQDAGGAGTYVYAGAANTFQYPKDLTVGLHGKGTFIVEGQKDFWWWYKDGEGSIVVGQSQEDNQFIINDGARVWAGYLYLGGRTEPGWGELLLRGGSWYGTVNNGEKKDDIFWLGCGPDAEGKIGPTSFGRICGWGLFTGDNSNFTGVRGIYVRLGHGEIVGDGDGDESHVLKCYNGIYQVANALPGVVTTSGWRAVNKGAVCLPGYTGGNGEVWSLTGCVGCATALEKPDLVNSIRMAATNLARGRDKHFGVQVLAADRTDAHTNSLPEGVNVLGVWKVGVFEGYGDHTTPSWTDGAIIDFRYDQTKLKKTTTQIELLRYEEATGRWTRLNRIKPNARPSDCIISTPTAVAHADETYNLGTFAAIESEVRGLIVVVK